MMISSMMIRPETRGAAMLTPAGCIAILASILFSLQNSAQANDLLAGCWATDSIRRYDESGNYLGDFVPTGGGGLDLPDGMDFGPDGHLYVSSSNTNQILRYNGSNGAFIDVFVNSGLNAPGNLKFGPDGLLYVCNKNTGQVLRFDPVTGNPLGVFASGGGLLSPVGLLWDDGLLYVSDFNGNAVRRYNATTGVFVNNFATVTTPLILNHDLDGNIMVSSHGLSNVLRYRTDGTPLGNFLSGGTVSCPVGYVFDGDGDLIVASWQNNQLLRYDEQNGSYVGQFAVGNGLAQPNDLLYLPALPAEVTADSIAVTRGDPVSGTTAELSESDNADVIISRGLFDIQAVTRLEIEATSPFATASTISVTLEGSVFARSTVRQTIELYDFEADGWESVDTRNASRLSDSVITVSVGGDPGRFVQPGTQHVRARVSFSSLTQRQQFSSNTDFFQWEITR